MGNHDFNTVMFRIDPEQNMRRFYTLSVQPNLFGGHSLVRNWGRIGTQGQYRLELFENAKTALAARDRLMKLKQARAYVVAL